MNKNQFLEYMNDPCAVEAKDIPVLEELIRKFPFFQSSYLLKAKALHLQHSIHYEKALHLAAAYASDRKVLYKLIHLQKEVIEPVIENSVLMEELPIEETLIIEKSLPEEEIPTLEETIEVTGIIGNIPLPIESEKETNDAENLNPVELIAEGNHRFIEWLQSTRTRQEKTEENTVPFRIDTSKEIKVKPANELEKLYQENIFHLGYELPELSTPKPITFKLNSPVKEDPIDRFLKNEPVIKITVDEQAAQQENKARKSSEDPEDLVSETLANILMQQKHYRKAIKAFEKLSLRNPEKSSYFAAQIEKIKKLYPEVG